jgi:hypothetical protein
VDRRIDSVYLITSLGHAMSDLADPVRLCPGSASDRAMHEGMTGDDALAFIYRALIEAARRRHR